MIVKLLTEHHLEFLSLKVGSRGSSESTHVKMSNCWKSHALAHICFCCSAVVYFMAYIWVFGVAVEPETVRSKIVK